MKKDRSPILSNQFLSPGLICHVYQSEEDISTIIKQIAPLCQEKKLKLAVSKNEKLSHTFNPAQVQFFDHTQLGTGFKDWFDQQHQQALKENFRGICLLVNFSNEQPAFLDNFYDHLKILTSIYNSSFVCHIDQHTLTTVWQYHLILNSRQIIIGTKWYSNPLYATDTPQDKELFEKLFLDFIQSSGKNQNLFFQNSDLKKQAGYLPIFMAEVDSKHNLLYANLPFREFFNNHSDFTGSIPLMDILGVSNFLILLPELTRVLNGEEIYFSKQITDQNQNPHDLTFTLIPRHKEGKTRQDQYQYYTLIAQDTTTRKVFEKQNLLQSKALETAANGIIITDRLGNILWANPAISKMTYYNLEEILNKNPRILKSSEHQPKFYQDLWNTISSGKVWHGEITNRRKDNSLYIEEMTITPVSIDGSKEISHFIAIKQDVSNRKSAEKALQESEERYRTMVESQGEGVAVFNAQLEFEYLNQAAEMIIGFTLAEVLGTSLLAIIPEKFQKIIWDQFIQRQSGKINSYELNVTRKDQQEITLLVTATPRYNPAGEFIGSFTVFRDITNRKQIENELRFQSVHDGLTGLFNRLHFEKKLQQLEDEHEFPLSIIMIDVDNLKILNDSRGHLAGDELLKKVGKMLHKSFRGNDVIARIGGDEFAILLPRTDWQSVQDLISRLQTNITEVNQTILNFPVSISIGSATAENDRQMINLFKIADERMYAQKRMKKSQLNSGV